MWFSSSSNQCTGDGGNKNGETILTKKKSCQIAKKIHFRALNYLTCQRIVKSLREKVGIPLIPLFSVPVTENR